MNKLLLSLLFAMISLFLVSNNSIATETSLYPQLETTQAEAKGKCIRPEEEMRKIHPDLLKHDRINTMRLGIRAKDESGKSLDGSLKACINCHAIKGDDGKYVRIDNEKHFCSTCHIYVGASLDCFQCHRDIPEK